MQPFDLSLEAVLSLPLDRLGLAILDDVVINEESNQVNWLQMASRGYPQAGVDALAEAWAWLHQTGLIAPGVVTMFTPGEFIVTRLGRRVAEEGLPTVRALQRLSLDLRPDIQEKVRPQYLMGEFELAAFAALRAVEIRVRKLTGESDSMLGVALMKKAFRDGGIIWDDEQDRGEQTARMELFAGAIGFFKNPTSHREVTYDDPAEAAEIIMLADLLMRVLDRVETRLPQNPAAT